MSETTRALATIAEISELIPIEKADRIVLARFVDRAWEVIVSKEDHQVGDKGVYFEPDSFLPAIPLYEDLRQRCFKKFPDGTDGFLVKTMKMRGIYSQGYFLKLDAFSELIDISENLLLHDDLTSLLKIRQWQDATLEGDEGAKPFPFFIPKTDEKRIENCVKYYSNWVSEKRPFIWTEKLDGCSFTAFLDVNGEFGYCSRNRQLLNSNENDKATSVYHEIVKNLKLEEKLRSLSKPIAIQGELIGGKIQGNRYKRPNLELYLFTIWNIEKRKRISLQKYAGKLGIPTIPIVKASEPLPAALSDLRHESEGQSLLTPSVEREGFVLRAVDDPSISFKVISRKFLSKLK